MSVDKTIDDAQESERQLILARGGSLSRKVNQEDEEDIFNDKGGFRIKINKEQKVVNHLDDKVENNNLLFYNFNAYKQESSTTYNERGKSRQRDEATSNYQGSVQGVRPYSR